MRGKEGERGPSTDGAAKRRGSAGCPPAAAEGHRRAKPERITELQREAASHGTAHEWTSTSPIAHAPATAARGIHSACDMANKIITQAKRGSVA